MNGFLQTHMLELLVIGGIVVMAIKGEKNDLDRPYSLSTCGCDDKLYDRLEKMSDHDSSLECEYILAKYDNRVYWRPCVLFSVVLVVFLYITKPTNLLVLFIIILAVLYFKSSYDHFHYWGPVYARLKALRKFKNHREDRENSKEGMTNTANDICPRTGRPVVDGIVSDYNGFTVGFCTPECAADFEANRNPEHTRFLDNAIADKYYN